MSVGVVGAVEYPVCPEHLVAVLQNGRPVGYSVHIYLVEVGLRGLVQVYPIIGRGLTVDHPAHTKVVPKNRDDNNRPYNLRLATWY